MSDNNKIVSTIVTITVGFVIILVSFMWSTYAAETKYIENGYSRIAVEGKTYLGQNWVKLD